MSDVTQILEAVARGDQASADELLPLVYQELRKLAAHKMAGQAPGHTLQPTALVQYVIDDVAKWIKLASNRNTSTQTRSLQDYYRRRAETLPW